MSTQDTSKKSCELDELVEIMQKLRDPDSGCPWDLEQDFSTIAPYTIEEAYEVADAIQRNNLDDLKDELGDLLLQVICHSQMASEAGSFNINDVIESICDKMIRRHPHVFSDQQISSAQEQTLAWEQIKANEKAEKRTQLGTNNELSSILDDVPSNLPGLLRAKKLTKKAASVGFDWPDSISIFQKLEEESKELLDAINTDNQVNIEEELGDLLFVIANLSRHLKVDPEKALRRTNQKFIQRFQWLETTLINQGRSLEVASLKEMDELWNQAKVIEKQKKS